MIALVDDDPDDLMFIQDGLQDATSDFKILPFLSSVAFIDYLNTATDLPVLVVLDYNMPKLNAEDILITMGSTPRLSSIKAFILSTGEPNTKRTACYTRCPLLYCKTYFYGWL